MSDIISRIIKINNAYESSGAKETELFELKRELNRDFKKPLDCEDDTRVNGKAQDLLITETKDPLIKKIKSRPHESFKIGDIVDCYGYKWLVTELNPNTQVRHSGKMIQCNYTLGFLDVENNEVFYPCCVENYTKYNSGTKVQGSTNQMELGATQFAIKLPFDANTKTLDRTYKSGVLKGKNQRLLIDFEADEPKVYEITMPDRVTNPGLLLLVVTESSDLSEDDNVEKMIANYYSRTSSVPPTPQPEPEQDVFAEIKYSGDPVLFLGGGYKKFEAIFKDMDGNILSDVVPNWDIEMTDNSFLTFLNIEVLGNVLRIKVLSENMIGVPIRLNLLSNSNGNNVLSFLDLVVMDVA